MAKKSSELEHKLDVFRANCRRAGLKITPQRTEVYKALVTTNEHPSAEMVFRKVRNVLPNISLDTVNRTLLTLNDIGSSFIVEGSGDPKRFDANLKNHQHFKCVRCKKIFDFCHEPFDKIEVPAIIKKKFTVLRKTVYLEGICNICKKKRDR
ncbi:MAG: Fur family transcriptional regulator [Planctomycetota bacterium]|jgi:Fur family peroxide stress response transcriptional regulator